jgi:hypothetical protein
VSFQPRQLQLRPVPPPLTTSTCRPCRSSTCASFRHPYPLPCLRGEAKTAQIANTIAISRALALPPTSFHCSPLPNVADVKRPDMPPATRAAARAFASTSQAEEHPYRSAATSDRLLLPPSGTPPRAGHSSPPPASPPQAPPWPGAPQRPCKLWPRPLRPLTGELPPPDRAAMGSATPVRPSPTDQIGPPPRHGVPRPPCSPPLAAGRRNRRHRCCLSSLAPLLQAVGCQPMGSWSAGWAWPNTAQEHSSLHNFLFDLVDYFK